MKKKFSLLVLLAIFAVPRLIAQSSCSNPPNCIQNIGTNPPSGTSLYAQGTVITNTMIPDWWIYSGSPIIGPGMNSSTGIELVSDVSNGEGMYTCYNFRSGVQYRICISAINTTLTTGGYFILEAHNGTSGQIIANTNTTPFYSSTLQEFTYTFTASSNYNRLVIRSYHPSPGTTNPYSVSFDDIGVVEIPVLTATPSNINECSTVTLNAASNNPLNITWSGSKLNSTTGTTVTASPCSNATYTASYRSNGCFDGWSCTKTEQVSVTVSSTTSIAANPQTIQGCGTVTLTASSANNMTVTWSGPNLLSSTGTTVYARPCKTSNYTAKFSCSNGCDYYEYITVFVQPGTNISASPQDIKVCQTSTLTATSTNPMSITWSPTTGLNPTTGPQVSASPCDTTKYYASFYCQANNCTYVDSIVVNVEPNGSIKDRSNTLCRDTIDLEYIPDNPCPGLTYTWYHYKTGSTPIGTGPRFFKATSSKSDQGLYWVVVTTPDGCIDTFYTSVIKDCCKVFADFDIDSTSCNPIRFVNKTVDGNGNPILTGQWFWDFGDGSNSSIRNPSHLYIHQLGIHEVCLTTVVTDDPATCCDKVCKDVDVCDFGCDVKAALTFRIDPVTGMVQFLDKSAGSGTAISWTWNIWQNGSPIGSSTLKDPTFSLPPGVYTVCLDVQFQQTGGSTCMDTGWCEEIEIK